MLLPPCFLVFYYNSSSKSTIFTRTNCDIPVISDLWLLPVDVIGGLAGSTSAWIATPPRKAVAFLWLIDSVPSPLPVLSGRLGTPYCLDG
jgi:hypothetical protein